MEVFSRVWELQISPSLLRKGCNEFYNAICFSVIILRRLIKP